MQLRRRVAVWRESYGDENKELKMFVTHVLSFNMQLLWMCARLEWTWDGNILKLLIFVYIFAFELIRSMRREQLVQNRILRMMYLSWLIPNWARSSIRWWVNHGKGWSRRWQWWLKQYSKFKWWWRLDSSSSSSWRPSAWSII